MAMATKKIATIATVVRNGVQIVLYLNGQVTATTLSITMITVMHLLIFSVELHSCRNEKDFTFQVRYSSGQKSWLKINAVYTQLNVMVRRSDTARLFKYCNAVLESLTLESTSRVRILPIMPQLQIVGQTAQYRIDFSSIIGNKGLIRSSFSVEVLFSNNEVETFSSKLGVVF